MREEGELVEPQINEESDGYYSKRRRLNNHLDDEGEIREDDDEPGAYHYQTSYRRPSERHHSYSSGRSPRRNASVLSRDNDSDKESAFREYYQNRRFNKRQTDQQQQDRQYHRRRHSHEEKVEATSQQESSEVPSQAHHNESRRSSVETTSESQPKASLLASLSKSEEVKFLTRAQRQQLRREMEALEAQKAEKQIKQLDQSRQEYFNKEARAREEERKRRQAEIEVGRKLKEEQRRRRDLEEQRKAEAGSDSDILKVSKKKKAVEETNFLDDTTLSPEEMRQREEEMEKDQIREQYLGMKKEKRKVQKPSEKFRNIFQFDWDGSEDTTRGDSNILYHKRHEPQLLFGRGFRAGVDVREQRRKNGFYDSLAKLRQEKLAQLNTEELDEKTLEELSVMKIMSSDKQPIMMRERVLEDEEVSTHWSVKSIEEMSDRDWRILREDFSIYVRGGRVPNPMRTWAESGLSPGILSAVEAAGYDKPTPIQMQAIPIAMEMKDMIGIAETGSGKTAAFMLPMIQYVLRYPKMTDETAQLGPHGLVLAPSRELAIQIREETVKFSANLDIRTVVLVGGRAPELQAIDLRKGAQILIGTPGRIKDCLEKAYTVLIQCDYVVLDEADRMIDLGFEEVVNWILDQIPCSNMKSQDENDIVTQELQAKTGARRYRVTQMFSATMPPSVERLAKKYLRQPAIISIGNPGAGKKSIEQRFEFISEGKKKMKLEELLEELGDLRIIIFVNQKKNADTIAKTLKRQGYAVVALHGGRSQDTRETSLDQFKTGEVNILVATDVAGRGLDVEDVHVVINMDMPKEIEAYTHRIGRTGRAGKKGLSISFVTDEDSPLFYDLRNLLISSGNLIPLEIQNHPASKQKATNTPA